MYLSFYPRGGGFVSTGIFKSAQGDLLFWPQEEKSIYRIDNLSVAGMQSYLTALNESVQTATLRQALQAKLTGPTTTSDERERCVTALASLEQASGYNAISHNCTTVVVRALRAGELEIPRPWFFESPTWLLGLARSPDSPYHAVEPAAFRAMAEEVQLNRLILPFLLCAGLI